MIFFIFGITFGIYCQRGLFKKLDGYQDFMIVKKVMSTDREEIRWQFQMLLDFSKQSVGALRDTRDRLMSEFNYNDRKISELRNFITGILGFVATMLVSLVAIKYLEDSTVPYIDYAIGIAVIGFIFYFSINWFVLYRSAILFQKIDTKYADALSHHYLMRTLISASGANLAGTIKICMLLRNFVVIIHDALIYDIYNFSNKIAGTTKPNQKQYRTSYENAKSIQNEIKKANFPFGQEIMDQFIKEFEKNEKSE